MFCNKCGTKIEDEDIKFCPQCGAKVGLAADKSEPDSQVIKPIAVSDLNEDNSKKSLKKRKPVLAAAVLIIVVICAFAAYNLSGRNYIELVDSYVESIVEGDTDDLIELLPKEYINKMASQNYGNDKKAFISDLNSILKNNEKILESQYGHDFDYNVKISEIEIDNEHLSSIKTQFKDNLNIKISDAKYLKLSINIYNGSKTYDSLSKSLSIIKIGNSWYAANLDDISFSMFDVLF